MSDIINSVAGVSFYVGVGILMGWFIIEVFKEPGGKLEKREYFRYLFYLGASLIWLAGILRLVILFN